MSRKGDKMAKNKPIKKKDIIKYADIAESLIGVEIELLAAKDVLSALAGLKSDCRKYYANAYLNKKVNNDYLSGIQQALNEVDAYIDKWFFL